MCPGILLVSPPKSKTHFLQYFHPQFTNLPEASSIPCRKSGRPVLCQDYCYLLGMASQTCITAFHPPTSVLLSEEFRHVAIRLESLQQRTDGCTLEYYTFTHP